MNKFFTRGIPRLCGLTLINLLCTTAVFAQSSELEVDEAVKAALSSDGRIESSLARLAASRASVDEQKKRNMIPSLSLSAGYTRLSHVSSAIDFGATSVVLESDDNIFTLSSDLSYPLFSGFRVQEAIRLASLQERSSEVYAAMMRRAVAFEVRRAYWEVVRAEKNVDMLKENLEITERNLDITRRKFEEGTVLNADLLEARMRRDQAEMEMGDAGASLDIARINLNALTGMDGEYTAASDPAVLNLQGEVKKMLSEPGDVSQFGALALKLRPEAQSAALSKAMAETVRSLAEAPLYPSLRLTGNYTFANPNSRYMFQSDPEFEGTWNIGLSLSYDLGGVPAQLAAIEEKTQDIRKAEAEQRRQEELIMQDVRTCLVRYRRSREDIDLVSRMLAQAEEKERVTGEQVANGTAAPVDLLEASVARLKSEYLIVNRQIDLQIRTADLQRSLGMDGISLE